MILKLTALFVLASFQNWHDCSIVPWIAAKIIENGQFSRSEQSKEHVTCWDNHIWGFFLDGLQVKYD